jgi:hypothetical protein
LSEAEWLDADDPGLMLDQIEGRVSDRKLRLFAVACCRRMWHLLGDPRSRAVVDVVEQYADGLVSTPVLQHAVESAAQVEEAEAADDGEPTPATAVWSIAHEPPFDAAYTCGTISVVMDRESMRDQPDWWVHHEREGEEEAKQQTTLLRCIVGNPFRPVALNPAWLSWNAGMVRHLAQAIYEERAFDRLPALASALEAAGCDDADILGHCRQSGPHARGCWVIDLVLGRS